MAAPVSEGLVQGLLDSPSSPSADGLVLAHGAGSDSRAPLLSAVAGTFAASGITVLRIDLPFRQSRPHGPPRPAEAARDREGIEQAISWLRARVAGRIFVGGHSYGGRQASMVAAEKPDLIAALLLLSYPLHPPRRPLQMRTAHLPDLRTPALFVHGTRDPFGSIAEMQQALKIIPAPVSLTPVEGAGHDLAPASRNAETALASFRLLVG